ncbi:uncharacterized protein LOC113995132 [Pipra filicauda]|uniref:Uncharacterized protein LOC113995132 n=1 Tax=Pipra filicauda TaxID=649802 RepID=A0A7R5KW11_9PASS|nr:uncharacterized protein LOC113995132 [Pipra filicauda]
MSRKRGSAEAAAGDDGRSARRKSSAAPSPKRPGSTGNSKGSLLKLANLQLPHGRKRGAEVLSAKIVRKSPEKPAEKGNDAPDIPNSPDAPDPAAKRARTAESPDTPSPVPDPIPIPVEVPRAERAPTPVKNKEQESPERDPSQAQGDDGRAGSELQEPLPDLPAQVSPQSHGEQSQGNEFYPAELGNECDSHGLNLLADLALGSCVSLYIPQDTEGTPVSPSTEVVPVPSSAEVIPVPYSPSSDSSQDDEGISVSYSSGMVPVSHRTGVTPVSHRTEVTPVSHNCGVIPVSHRTEVFTVSHNSGVIPVSHRTEVFTVSHRTGVIPVSHSTGVILVSHSTEVIPASHSTGVIPVSHSTEVIPASHSTGVIPVSHSTEVIPASHSTGVIPVSHSSSSYSPPDTEVILVSQSPSSDSPQDSEVIPVSHSTEVIPASSNPSGDSPQDAEDAEVIPEAIPVSLSPPSASPQEQQGRPQLRSPRAAPAPDPKHQRPGRRTASTGRAAPNQALPAAGKPGSNAGKPGFNGSTAATAAPRERTSGIPSQSGVRPGWAGERQHCAVALEHSYAMVGPPELRRRGTNPPGTSPPGTNPPGTPTSGAAPAQNGTGRARAGPLVGKVLPFRRQPGGSRPPWVPEGTRSRTGSARDKEDFAKCHTVRARGKSLKVTLQWDGHYAHNLDTRYTNNILERSVIRALHGPWDCSLPETVEDMKLILHTWVALFYRRPSAQLNSSRKVVEHRDPKKYVLLNSSNCFWDLSDDDLEPRGRKTCPADSRSDPDQTPSSSVDPGTPRKGSSRREKGRPHLRLRSYANGAAGGVDSTVSSSSGELPGEEEEPSSTSCPESVPEGVPSAEESLDEGEGQPGISEDVSSVTAEEPPDAAITPSPSEEPGRASERPAVPGMENSRSLAPNSSAAPCTDSQGGIPRDGEQQEREREAGAGRGSPRDSESAGDAGHGTEVEDSRDSSRATSDPWDSMPLEASPGSASHPRRARDSVPLEASPRSANLAGASKEGLESQDPFGHLEKEEGELEEDKEENEEDFEEVLGSVDLVLSESSDTEMESEHSDQKTGSSPLPEDFGAPGEDSVPSPSSLASPCLGSSTLMMSDGTWTGSWSGIDSPGLPGERAPSVDEPPEPWDAPATPCSETGGVGVASPAHVGSPRDSGEMIPPDPGLFHGAQPDSVTGSPEPAGETLGNDLEQKDRNHVTAEERWESSDVRSPRDSGATFPPDPGLFHEAQPVCGAAGETLGNDLEQKDRDHMPTEERWESSDVGSPRDSGETFPPDPGLFYGAQPDSVTGSSGAAGETLGDDLEQKDRGHVPATGNRDGLESPHSQGLALPLSPHSNSAYLMSPDGSIDPRAAPEDQETTAGFPSPSRRDLGRSSCFSREQGDDVGADPGEPNQERSEVLGEEPGSPCSNGTGMPDDPMGAGGGQDFPLDYRAAGGDPGAGEGEDVCPGAENSPRSDRTDMEMGGDTPQEPEMPLHPPLESEPSSLEREGMSALEELPGQRRSFPHSPSPSSPGYSAPASPAYQEDTEPPSSEQSPWEPALGQPWNSWEEGGAPEGSVGARSLEGSVNPRCSGGVIRYPAPRPAGRARGSPVDVLPREPRSRSPPPPHSLQDGLHGTEPGSVLDVYPGMVPPGTDSAPDDASWSCSPCASPGSQREEPIPPEDWEEGRSILFSSAPSSPEGDLLDPWHEPHSAWEDSGSEEFPDPGDEESEAFPDPYRASRDMGPEAFPDPHRASAEVEEGEILTSPIPALPFREHRDPSGERLEFSDAEDALDTFPRAQQLLSRDTRRAVAFQDPLDLSSSDSEQEYFGRNPRPPLPARASRGARSVDAAGTRTNGNDSSVEGQGDDWGQGLPRDSRRSVITRHRRERPGSSQTPRRRRRRPGESHLLRNNLLGDWRGSEELTQNTLDMECLRFHYKLNQVLGNRKPPFSTSESIFPRDFSRRDPPAPPSARGRSPLQVTIPPSHTWPGRSRSHRQRGWHDEDTPGDTRRRSPSRSRPPFRLGKLRQDGRPLDSPGDVTVVLDEYSELPRVVLSRADAGKEGGGHGEPRDAGPGPSRRGRPAAFQGMIGELCGALRSHLRRVASEASTHPGMFYLVETGKEPFFERVKALLRKEGWVRTEPRSFSGGRRRAGDQLLVIIRNEDISSHIHTIPGLLELKRCPGVVFAGVDNPEDVTGHTYQELFHTGGFLVSDHHVLESMSLARLKEVVKVLEKLNRSGRWKWLLHYWESKKLRGDLRVAPDAHGKQLLLKWCQEEGLVEVLPFHGCDSPGAPEKQLLRCLLGLQVQHVRARLGVFLTRTGCVCHR